MDRTTRECISGGRSMAEVSFSGLTEQSTKENGATTKWTGKVNLSGQMAEYTKVTI